MSFLKHLDSGECKEAAHEERVDLISDYCSIEELRFVISNFRSLISEKVGKIADRMKTDSLLKEDFYVFNSLSRVKPAFDNGFRPEIYYNISNVSKVNIFNTTCYMLPVRMELIDTTPKTNNRSGYVSVNEDITLFRTVVMLEKEDYVKIKLKSNNDGYTSIVANIF